MYIEEIREKGGGTIRISSEDEELGQQMDFDTRLMTDGEVLSQVEKSMISQGVAHYLVLENATQDGKQVDFYSERVKVTIYFIQDNGKVYRWTNVAISFVRKNVTGTPIPIATVVASSLNVRPFNRRGSFRVTVDQMGSLHYDNENHPCMVRDVSHGGFSVIFRGDVKLPSINQECFLTWSEEIKSDSGAKVSAKYELQGVVVRAQVRLGRSVVIGCSMEKEPDPLRDYIQRAQTSRGIVREAEEKSSKSGVKRVSSHQLEDDLKKMTGGGEESDG